jgi:hypothetical protein
VGPPTPLTRVHGFRLPLIDAPHLLSGPFVYAITDGTSIKLGTSKGHPRARMADLQTGSSRELILLAYDARTTEKQVHRLLHRHRLRGEWFRPHPQVLALVRLWDWVDAEALEGVTHAR